MADELQWYRVHYTNQNGEDSTVDVRALDPLAALAYARRGHPIYKKVYKATLIS